jgi:cell division transport system permease protein
MEVYEQSTSSRKTKSVYVSTIISIALVLLMTGLLGLILIHAKNLSRYVRENIVLNVIMNEDTSEANVLSFRKKLDAHPYVLNSSYISKDSAAASLSAELGEDFVSFLGHNPLSASIDVFLKADYANADSIDLFIEKFAADKQVNEIIYQESLLETINQNIRIIGLVILAFAVILLIIAIALINNTIRLAIYSQRFIIKSMQLVGATQSFIRKPFLNYGALHGLIGGIIAVGLLLMTIFFAQREIPELKILTNWFEFGLIFAGVVVLGIIISVLSTFFAVSKYLRLRANDLYR